MVKNSKISFECSKECNKCPFIKTKDLSIYIKPSTYRIEEIFYCQWRKRYSETMEKLPSSRMKYTHDLRLRKAYDSLKEKFYRKGVKHITDETIKECILNIENCMTPNAESEAYNEYGHYHVELEDVEIRENNYGYTVYHSGRMGDYGWTQSILVHKRCDTDRLHMALRKRYGHVVSMDIR